MRFGSAVLFAATLAVGGCRPNRAPDAPAPTVNSASTSEAPPLSENPEARIGPFAIDLDGDRIADSLTLIAFPDSEMPPAFGGLAVYLSTRHVDTLLRGYWDAPGSAHFNGGVNLIASNDFFVARGTGDRSFLFMFGQDGIMPMQDLTIYEVTKHGIREYYNPGPFEFDAPASRENGRITGIRGIAGGWPEGMILEHGDTLGGGSYVPTLVLRLGDSITIDSAATQAATRKALGGFAGYSPSADIVVNMKNGTRFVISSKDHRRLP